jgi:hypothetical protein
MTNTKSEKELVFEVGAEGGSLEIYRAKNNNVGFNYFLRVSEYDIVEDVASSHRSCLSDNFYSTLSLLEDNYAWFDLYPLFVHEDFREDIADFLVEKLNKKEISNENFKIHKQDWESQLHVNFIYGHHVLEVDYKKIIVSEISKNKGFEYENYGENYDQKLLVNTEESFSYSEPSTHRLPDYNGFLGTVKVVGNSILLLDRKGEIDTIIPADKFIVRVFPVTSKEKTWDWFHE